MTINNEREVCPICQSDKTDTVWFNPDSELYRGAVSSKGPISTFRMDLHLRYCSSCQHGFLNPSPSDKTLSAYYRHEYGAYTSPLLTSGLTASLSDPAVDFICRRVQDRIGDKARIVEVGGFDGYVLAQLKNVASSILLIEPSEDGACIAADHGVPIINQDLDKTLADELSGQFDVVICRQVIEHVRNPDMFAQHLVSLLSPRGLLFIETDDLAEVLRRVFVRTVILEHLNLFTPQSLSDILESCGVVVTELEYIENYAFMIEASKTGDKINLVKRSVDSRSVQQKYVEEFASRLQAYVADLSSLVQGWRSEGKRIWVWGAGTAAGELFNVYGQQPDAFCGYIDSDPNKAGMILPRSPSLVIQTPDAAFEQGVDAVLITSYATDEIAASIRKRGWNVDIADIYNFAH